MLGRSGQYQADSPAARNFTTFSGAWNLRVGSALFDQRILVLRTNSSAAREIYN